MSLDVVNKALYYAHSFIGISTLAFLAFEHFKKILCCKILRKTVWLIAAFNVVIIFLEIFIEYKGYAADPIGKFLLPPYQSWLWFAQYSFFHFLAPFLFAVGAGILVYYFVILINPVRSSLKVILIRFAARRSRLCGLEHHLLKANRQTSNGVNHYDENSVFARTDRYFFLLAALIVGWPNFLIFLAMAFALALIYGCALAIRQRKIRVAADMTNVLIAATALALVFGSEIGKYFDIYLLTI